MRVRERIASGALPSVLEGADWRMYGGADLAADWHGFARMWWCVGWVRCQAFERCADAEWAADEYEAANG